MGVLSFGDRSIVHRALSHFTTLPRLFFHLVFFDKTNTKLWLGATFFHYTLFGAEFYAAASWLSPTDSTCFYRGCLS